MNAVDEMMVRYFGRSGHTFRMRNKPIKEGFKVWGLSCSNTGFCYTFTPGSRQNTIDADDYTKTKKKIKGLPNEGDTVQLMRYLISQLPDDLKFKLLVLDNYFTFSSVIKLLRELEVGVLGTARARRGWPPEPLRSMVSNNFNCMFHQIDAVGTRVFKWKDNGDVLFVSTIHSEDKSVPKQRKRPRKTIKNNKHVQDVWGLNSRVWINIPELTDDYNCHMNACDRSDQLIAALTMLHNCIRNWLPLFKFGLNVIRINSYVVHKDLAGDDALSHIDFTLSFVEALIARGKASSQTQQNQAVPSAPESSSSSSSSSSTSTAAPATPMMANPNRSSKSSPVIEHENRFDTSINHRFVCFKDCVGGEEVKKATCVLCNKIMREQKAAGVAFVPSYGVKTGCTGCPGIALCSNHYTQYHTP